MTPSAPAPHNTTWGTVARCFHWGMAALLLLQLVLGALAASWRLSPTKINLFVWHKSMGVLLLVLVLARLLWRWSTPTPPLPVTLPAWERHAARASHGLLYALMLALPLSGWVLGSAAGVPFRVFWLLPLPALVAPDKAVATLAAQTHAALWIAMVLVLIVHIAAALRHHFVLHDDVLTRMAPWWRRRTQETPP